MNLTLTNNPEEGTLYNNIEEDTLKKIPRIGIVKDSFKKIQWRRYHEE